MAEDTQQQDPETLQGDSGDVDMPEPARDDVYDPSDVTVTRGREQGLGVGARDLQRQGDPKGDDTDVDLERAVQPTNPALNATQTGADPDSREDSNRRA